VAGLLENRVYTIPVTTATWVCTGRTRALRETRLGVKTRRRGPGKADNGEARHGGVDEQSSRREGGEEGEKMSARFLTPRRSFGGGLQQQKSDEAATATEKQR
jgi:hypothetical protein